MPDVGQPVRAGLSCTTPSGGFYVFVSCNGLLGSDEEFCNHLLESQQVAVIHGAAYGSPGHFRISFATSSAVLTESWERIARACADLT